MLTDHRPAFSLSTDILVVGGGAAGVAAATTAARQGLKVILVERYGFCGGGAVAGLSGTICGMYEASDNPSAPPRQVVFGFLDEFVKLMESKNGLAPAVKYGKTYTPRPRPACLAGNRRPPPHLRRCAHPLPHLRHLRPPPWQ